MSTQIFGKKTCKKNNDINNVAASFSYHGFYATVLNKKMKKWSFLVFFSSNCPVLFLFSLTAIIIIIIIIFGVILLLNVHVQCFL